MNGTLAYWNSLKNTLIVLFGLMLNIRSCLMSIDKKLICSASHSTLCRSCFFCLWFAHALREVVFCYFVAESQVLFHNWLHLEEQASIQGRVLPILSPQQLTAVLVGDLWASSYKSPLISLSSQLTTHWGNGNKE